MRHKSLESNIMIVNLHYEKILRMHSDNEDFLNITADRCSPH